MWHRKRLTVFDRLGLTILSVLLLTCTQGCDKSPIELAHRLPQGFVKLDLNEWAPPRQDTKWADEYNEPLETDSIELFSYRGGTYYHPVFMINRCKHFIDAYSVSEDSVYLRRAIRYVRKLMALSELHNDGAYLPYPFRFAVHGDSSLTFEPPWYSGMAQGAGLSVVMRIYDITEEEEFLDYGKILFATFAHPRSSDTPWVSRIDSAGFYWIEEYPHNEKPGMTLNGFIAAVFGIYEFYCQTDDPRAKSILEMALTTIKQYMPEYRKHYQKSLYCLGHEAPSRAYHFLHIAQMKQLYRITHDEYFQLMAEMLTYDSDNEPPDDN